MTHELKTLPPFFEKVVSGEKTFEVRVNDRDYQAGDFLLLKEFDGEKFTGRKIEVRVPYILYGGQFGIAKDTVVMAIKRGW